MNRKLLHVLSGAIAISVLASLPRVPTVSFGGLESLVVYAQVQPEMTLERLDAILREAASEVEGEAGQWQVTLWLTDKTRPSRIGTSVF
jgi:cell division inhibitor SulA